MKDYKNELTSYLEELYNSYYEFFEDDNKEYGKYPVQKVLNEKFGTNFNEFLSKRNTTKDELADFILVSERIIKNKKNRVEPIVSAFHRAVGYFILKSSIYKLKNNPIDIFYNENSNNPYFEEIKKFIPLPYSLTIFPNRVGNNEKVGFNVIFYAKKEKREEIKDLINTIAFYLYEFVKYAYNELNPRSKKIEFLVDYYNLMLGKMVEIYKNVYQEFKPKKEQNQDRINELLGKLTHIQSDEERVTMDEFFKTLSELNKEVGNNVVYKSIAQSFVVMLFFFNPFVKLLGFDLMNIVDGDYHLKKGIDNLYKNFNLTFKDFRFLIRDYKIEDGKLKSVDIDFDIVEDPAEINLLFYKKIPKEKFERLAKVFYDLAMFFSYINIRMSLSFVKNENGTRAIYKKLYFVLNKFIELFDEFERRYIFGNGDFYLDIVKDKVLADKFIELVFLSYILFDNAVFFYSSYFGITSDRLDYTIDPVYLAVASSTYYIVSIPLIFYSAISGPWGINFNRKGDDKEYSIFSGDNNSIAKAYYTIIGFDKDIKYDITNLSLYFKNALKDEISKKLLLYSFEALSSASLHGMTERMIFSELNRMHGGAKKVFDATEILSNLRDEVDFTIERSVVLDSLPAFDKLLLALSGITSTTIATTDYNEAKANQVIVEKVNGKLKKKYFNKPLALIYKEETENSVGYTNLYHYIENLTNPVFNYLGLVNGLTQFSACNPFITPLFSNVVNCRSNLFKNEIEGMLLKGDPGDDGFTRINDEIVFGIIAHYIYSEFLNREFDLKIKYDFSQSLKNELIKKVDDNLYQISKEMLDIVKRFHAKLENNYQNRIRNHFTSNMLYFDKASLISVYSLRALKDANNEPDYNVSIVVSNTSPANLGLYTSAIQLAGSIVYASLSEMYMFKVDKSITEEELEKDLANAYRIIEDYIYAKLLIPNLMLNWMTVFSAFAGDEKAGSYRRNMNEDFAFLLSLFSPGFDISILDYDIVKKTRNTGVLLSYIFHQVFPDRIGDANDSKEYLAIEEARNKLFEEIEMDYIRRR